MADRVTLDAMIRRADFAVGPENPGASEQIQTLSIESLTQNSMIVPMLRKPDFQRETNQWTPLQLVTFLKSYLDQELIPSVILWRSPAHVFVIDGGHRLSALRAWIEDDYGDGNISRQYFGHEISDDQRRVAIRTRNLVAAQIGSYAEVKSALFAETGYSDLMKARARSMATRQLSLQWVVGDAEKAESSFFKINTQGTPLDKTEELVLRYRKTPVAIAARSIFRAGTGHEYWSQFDKQTSDQIVESAKKIHNLLFKPELKQPIKTLALPLAGGVAPLNALDLLIRFVSLANGNQIKQFPAISDFSEDVDGGETISVLKRSYRAASWMTGNEPNSLGLHPAVYFYTDQGRHNSDMFLAFLSLIARKVESNQKEFFKTFTNNREKIESFLLSLKPILALLVNSVTSRSRVQRLSQFLEALVERANFGQALDNSWAIEYIAPNSRAKILMVTASVDGSEISKETKSAVYLRESLSNAVKCPICKGLIEPSLSVSYDHEERVRDGGSGDPSNINLSHPY
jgi:hypothetical protein